MSIHGECKFDWADEEHTFRLGLKEIRELQEHKHIGVGPLALFKRIEAGEWKIDDLRETIRLGLIGGGMKPEMALKKVRRYVDDFPKVMSVEPALTILGAFLVGDPVEPVGKRSAVKDVNEEMDASPLPPS